MQCVFKIEFLYKYVPVQILNKIKKVDDDILITPIQASFKNTRSLNLFIKKLLKTKLTGHYFAKRPEFGHLLAEISKIFSVCINKLVAQRLTVKNRIIRFVPAIYRRNLIK